MLSILIPVKDYVCHPFVNDLQREGEALGGVPYEVIVADDASEKKELAATNRVIGNLPHCRYIELKENMGRARIRNFLAEQAQYEWLLFIDSDAALLSASFLKDYISAAVSGAPVVCGGVLHPDTLPSPDCALRYRYEKRADRQRKASFRRQQPYERFSTFNFLIRKDLFTSIRFNDAICNYGFEDTLFGTELKNRKIPVLHIDNPLYHLGIEPSRLFLSKTETALHNLYLLRRSLQTDSGLLRAEFKLRRCGMKRPMAVLWSLFAGMMRRNLLGRHPSLLLFSLYKLGYYCRIK